MADKQPWEVKPHVGDVVTKAPASVIAICITFLIVIVIGSVVILSVTGHSSDDLFRVLNLILNTVGLFSSTGALLYAGAAAKSAHQSAEQTNGSLDKRMEVAATKAVSNTIGNGVNNG